jgi:aminopeptidase N
MRPRPTRAALALALAAAATAASARAPGGTLTRADAAERAALVRDPAYELSLSLGADDKDFSGRETLRFALEAPAEGLTVDFEGGAVSALTVNGSSVAAPDVSAGFFVLPKSALRAGENVVALSYTAPYSVDGSGLYRFRDPEDERVYLYTNFEPYAAHRVFPCFDQPDLKAAYSLTVDAPASWTVISTGRETGVAGSGARRVWTFAKTAKLSAYVFSVHAGPYHVWTSTAGAVPLRLFARESLARYVQADEWLDVTRRGLDFYGTYFGIPYPFAKYDQLIVPDFNEGAMENVGAVTFGERYVSRSTQTLEEREQAADVILHEMAHMWFGDLVTMKWWDGLWLNESFATYMAALSRARATRFPLAWQTFFGDMKSWAYTEDQRATTHPIEAEVPDTGQAFANFDGITYGKGASVLKQLAFLLGEDKFRDGVRLYLKDHAYGNSVEADFFGAMTKASGAELGAWRREWLDAAGVNTVRADYACGSGGRISSFALVQTAPAEQAALRRHRTRVGLFEDGPDGSLREASAVSVFYEGARTEIPELAGLPCPSFVYPNLGDEDYAKVELDARSLETAKTRIARIPDPHLREMLWASLWEMVRDAKWPVSRYANLVLSSLVDETDFKTASAVLETVGGRGESSPSVLSYLEKPDYPRFEAFFLAGLAKAVPGGDFQKLWFDGYVKTAASPAAVERLQGLLDGSVRVEGLPLDQDRRWDVIERLSELDAPGADGLIEDEARRDPADTGAKAAITARAARPDPETKKVWFARIVDPKSASSLGELRAAMDGFYPRTQSRLRAAFLTPFLETLPALAAAKSDDFLDAYGRAMVPAVCTPEGESALASFLEKTPPAKPVLLRALRDARQEDERCVRVRALDSR